MLVSLTGAHHPYRNRHKDEVGRAARGASGLAVRQETLGCVRHPGNERICLPPLCRRLLYPTMSAAMVCSKKPLSEQGFEARKGK